MEFKRFKQRRLTACLLSGLGLMLAVSTGCQATKSEQTLPPAYSGGDDVPYFPEGPGFVLPNAVEEQENFNLRQEHTEQGTVGKARVQ